MAAPHIAGLILTLIGKDPTKYKDPAALIKAILELANKNSKVQPPLPAGTTTLIGFNGL